MFFFLFFRPFAPPFSHHSITLPPTITTTTTITAITTHMPVFNVLDGRQAASALIESKAQRLRRAVDRARAQFQTTRYPRLPSRQSPAIPHS